MDLATIPVRRLARLAPASVWLALLAHSSLFGQEPEPTQVPATEPRPAAAAPEPEQAPTAETVAERRRLLAAEIAALEAERRAARPERTTADTESALERLVRLRDIDQVLARQQSELARQRRIQEEREGLEELRSRGVEALFEHGSPYSVEELDQVADRRRRATATVSILDQAATETVETLEAARGQTAERERERRRTREQMESSADPAAAPALLRQRRAAEEEARLARARQQLLELELSNTRSELELQRDRDSLFAGFERIVRQALAPSDAEREQRLFEIEETIADLRDQLAQLELELGAARDRWAASRQRLDETEPPPAESVEEVEARRLELESLQRRQELVEDRIGWLEKRRRVVELRFENLTESLRDAEKESEALWLAELRGELERARRRNDGRILQTRAGIAELEAQLSSLSPESGRGRWLTEQRAHLESILALHQQAIGQQEALLARIEGTLEELQEVSAWERFESGIRRGWRAAVALWQFEVFVVQDQSITVGKIVLTLILVLVGYYVAKRFASFLGNRVFPRLGLQPAAAAAFQTLIFYFLVVLIGLYALDLVNIPLTVFTVLGGALALGVGFGSQNIVNNFISGLILLAERPIKVGDLVDVDGIYGKVEHIGMRSTWVRSGDNTHIIVPNSAFLEKNVLNWTLSDETIRTQLDVGVAYGSPTTKVAELLLRSMSENKRILEHPKPEVLFTEFGDSALVFRAYFWIRIQRVLDRIRIQSDLRYRIDTLFREANITIAFPQRDVHLDSDAPLAVRVLGAAKETSVPDEEKVRS